MGKNNIENEFERGLNLWVPPNMCEFLRLIVMNILSINPL